MVCGVALARDWSGKVVPTSSNICSRVCGAEMQAHFQPRILIEDTGRARNQSGSSAGMG